MGTQGYFAYHYNGKYYRRYLSNNAHISGYGQLFANSIPRDPSAFNEWVTNKIKMLENANIGSKKVVHRNPSATSSSGSVGEDDLGFELRTDKDWTFSWYESNYTYVIDLDNLVFTVDGETHLKLDSMPPNDPGLEAYFGDKDGIEVPSQYLNTMLDFWPLPKFNIEERQKQYESLKPIITCVAEWEAWTWDKLSVSQRFSIDLIHHLISKTPHKMNYAYLPSIEEKTGQFCWEIVCAFMSSIPFFFDNPHVSSGRQHRTRSSRHSRRKPYRMCYGTGLVTFKAFDASLSCDYCWIRGCLVTFCVRLSEHAYVAHEVEQMVQKMRFDERAECVGIIISSQQEIIAVAVDDGLEPTRKVRHTPVLDLRPNTDKPGQASDGLLLLVHLLNHPLTIPAIPWRTLPHRSSQSLTWSQSKLPFDVIQHIFRYIGTIDYLSLSRVSRLVRSVYLENPRFGDYTILYKIPGHKLTYAARYLGEDITVVLELNWDDTSHWKARLYSSEEIKSLDKRLKVVGTRVDARTGGTN